MFILVAERGEGGAVEMRKAWTLRGGERRYLALVHSQTFFFKCKVKIPCKL